MIAIAIIFLFACAAVVGIVLSALACESLEPLADGPKTGKLNPGWAIGLLVLVALCLMYRRVSLPEFGIVALVSVPLVAAWYSDAKTGLIPDYFTLVPLGAMLLFDIVHVARMRVDAAGGQHALASLVGAGVICVAYGLSALLSKGKGMGWGDVKLATFAGAVLTLMPSLLTLALASLIATIAAVIRDRGKSPVAFGPYIAGVTMLAMALVG